MDELQITEQIERILLKIVTHKDKPEIIFIYIDSSVDKNMKTVPFLNIYGSTLHDNSNFNDAVQLAIDSCNYGCIEDILNNVDSSDFEINMSTFYPGWPDNLEIGDEKIVKIINAFIHNNKKEFKSIKKLYFDHIDHFNFVKIID